MTTDAPRRLGRLETLALGAVAAALLWLAGARELTFLGFVLAALAREGHLGRR